ncbi:gamma-glutamylcyclotransferase [Haloferula sp. A504]|uniref:gamma-glutamylcyclotransferase n=1 Tax=Haloferula sp. A504 TaxID=3373601 RepID=UPI0031C1D377|nr:gamma-glutamylcyclotransferase [Verrucomicrobiaceae bacterium E54]
MDTDSEWVFVYGTLRIGASNQHRMKGAEWVRRGLVTGRLYEVSWYPGFVPDDEGVEVVGDVYRVGPQLLAKLDGFEGLAPGSMRGEEYERARIRVRLDPKVDAWDDLPDDVDAWVWVWRKPVEGLLEIETGDWLDVERPRQPSWFTGLGCLGLLAIPFGGMAMQGFAGRLGLGMDADLSACLLLFGAGAGGIWAGVVALRRRERGQPLQVLMLAGAVLWLFFALMFLSELVNH